MDWLQFNMKSLDESAYKVLYKKIPVFGLH